MPCNSRNLKYISQIAQFSAAAFRHSMLTKASPTGSHPAHYLEAYDGGPGLASYPGGRASITLRKL